MGLQSGKSIYGKVLRCRFIWWRLTFLEVDFALCMPIYRFWLSSSCFSLWGGSGFKILVRLVHGRDSSCRGCIRTRVGYGWIGLGLSVATGHWPLARCIKDLTKSLFILLNMIALLLRYLSPVFQCCIQYFWSAEYRSSCQDRSRSNLKPYLDLVQGCDHAGFVDIFKYLLEYASSWLIWRSCLRVVNYIV